MQQKYDDEKRKISLKSVTCDFEYAFSKTFMLYFPEVHCDCSNFHFKSALKRQVKRNGFYKKENKKTINSFIIDLVTCDGESIKKTIITRRIIQDFCEINKYIMINIIKY